MQSVSSRIWIRVALSISYNDNHYTTDTLFICTYVTLIYLLRPAVASPILFGIKLTRIDQVDREFANGPGDLCSMSGYVIPKIFKMVLDTSLLHTQQYKECIKGKVEQSREKSSTLPYTSV